MMYYNFRVKNMTVPGSFLAGTVVNQTCNFTKGAIIGH